MPKYYRYDDPQLGCVCLQVPDGKELPAEYVGKAVPVDIQLEPSVWEPFEWPGLERVDVSLGSTFRPVPNEGAHHA